MYVFDAHDNSSSKLVDTSSKMFEFLKRRTDQILHFLTSELSNEKCLNSIKNKNYIEYLFTFEAYNYNLVQKFVIRS